MVELIIKISNWIWGVPMIIVLFGGGLWLTISLGFFQFRHFAFICKQTFGKLFVRSNNDGKITPLQATFFALAATIGVSNIVGVPIAIAFGGPGAVFWMWVTALVGSATKFSEVMLGVKYREKNEEGNYVGGPMYYMKKGLGGSLGKIMSIIFAFCLMVEIVPSIGSQTVTVVQTAETLGITPIITGTVLFVIVSIIVFGGLKRIVTVTNKLVPFMALFYLVCAFAIVIINVDKIPPMIGLIFRYAFTPAAPIGGFAGAAIAGAMRWGFARGAFSNEAGMGTATVAHSAAETDHPARQGMWGIFEVIVDTLIICTTTALVVLTTGLWTEVPASKAASTTALAFQGLFGETFGSVIVTTGILLFVLSSMIACIYFGEKQAEYLFGLKFSKAMRVVYVVSIAGGVFGGLEFMFQFLDIFLAAVIFPNMLTLILKTKEIKELKNDFFNNHMERLKCTKTSLPHQ